MRVPRGRPSMRDLYMRTTSEAARLMKRATPSRRLMMAKHSVEKRPEPGRAQAGRGDADAVQAFLFEVIDPDAAIEDEVANEHPIGRNRRVRTRPAHAQGVGQEPF